MIELNKVYKDEIATIESELRSAQRSIHRAEADTKEAKRLCDIFETQRNDVLDEAKQLREQLAAKEEHIERLMETFVNLAAKLGIDYDEAEKSTGKPSDMFFTYFDQLREQLAAAEKDAKRYLWLRNNTVNDGEVDESLYVSVDSDSWPNKWALFGEDLDAAIDAAMKGNNCENHRRNRAECGV